MKGQDDRPRSLGSPLKIMGFVRKGNNRFLFRLEKGMPVQVLTSAWCRPETPRGRPVAGVCNKVVKGCTGLVVRTPLGKKGGVGRKILTMVF